MLERNEFQCAMSTVRATEIFEEEWTRYAEQFKCRLETTERKWLDVHVQHEVRRTFDTVLGIHKSEILSVASKSLQGQSNLGDSTSQFTNCDTTKWFDRYLEIKPARIHRPSKDTARIPNTTTSSPQEVVREVVSKMKKKVE